MNVRFNRSIERYMALVHIDNGNHDAIVTSARLWLEQARDESHPEPLGALECVDGALEEKFRRWFPEWTTLAADDSHTWLIAGLEASPFWRDDNEL